MANFNDQNQDFLILNITNYAHITYPITPIGSHLRAHQVFSKSSRVGQYSNPLIHIV